MYEARINWGQKVELVAQAAVRTPEAIKIKRPDNIDSDTPIQYGSPEYFRIISEVVGVASNRKSSFSQRVVGKVMAGLPGYKKFWKAGFEATAREDNSNVLPKFHANLTTTARVTLPDVLDELAQAPANEPVRQDIVSIGDRLRNGDPALELKFALDSLHGTFDGVGVNQYSRRKLLFELAKNGLPQLRDPKPENLTPELLETIENYGLQDYANIYDFFNGIHRAREVGQQYDRRRVGYENRPSKDEVSPIPYEERSRAWERDRMDYEQQKINVAQQLSDLESHSVSKPSYFGKESVEVLDKEWVTANLPEVERILSGVLDHPMTSNIMIEAAKPDYAFSFSLFAGRHGPMPDFQAVAGAIKTVSEYAKSHPSEYSTDLLMMSLDRFKSLSMGLYNLKEGKN